MAKSAPAGIMVTIAGIFVIVQIWWGSAVERLGL